jgi:hypothetical protein
MLAWSILPAALLGTAAVATSPGQEIIVAGREVRLGDVVGLVGLTPALPASFAPRIVARLPAGAASVTLSGSQLATLVRRSVPGLEVLAPKSAVTIRRRAEEAAAAAAAPTGICFALSRPVARGAALMAGDAVATPCREGEPRARLAFDRRDHRVRAAADLAAATYLGRVSLPAGSGVERGDALTLVSTIGSVRVQRKVVAVQPGRSGGKVFVRDEDGQVLTAPLSLADAQEGRR